MLDKDFQLQQASKLKPKTINNITALLNDKEASSFLKKGQVVPDEILTKLKIAPSEAATATVRIGQIYGGNKFDEKAFKNIRTNVKASDNLFNTMNKFAFGNPYRSKLYNASLELIDEQLGNEKGTFASLKKKASYILKKNKIKGFDINEIAGVSGTAKSGAGEFSQFIDVMDSNLNQKQMASFQSAFSQARQNIANNPNNFAAESKRINKLASRFEREYGVKLPRIRDVGDVEKYYSANRLKNLSDQGLDIKKASKNVGYTIQMPKGAKTITEFIDKPDLTRLAVIGCGRKAAFDGGRINFDQGGTPVYLEDSMFKDKDYLSMMKNTDKFEGILDLLLKEKRKPSDKEFKKAVELYKMMEDQSADFSDKFDPGDKYTDAKDIDPKDRRPMELLIMEKMLGETDKRISDKDVELGKMIKDMDSGAGGYKDGGLMNLGGREMDMRTGGFIPIGKKERADDVPARLSKNEFVMTADAVRAAGGGSVNKGAKRMYDLMNNLEARV